VRPYVIEPALGLRHGLLAPEREAMARAVAERIEAGQVVALGAGATTRMSRAGWRRICVI
jgi:DeoR/GlpR family transcriptional regulator of sugar metabolism